MDTSQLKRYAPAARKAFIVAVSAQAAKLGISASGIATAVVKGDVFLVDGQAMPGSVADTRKRLVKRVEDAGFAATMEAAAYTWFNRFVALRYMELHGYLDHGYRVLSHPESSETDQRQPEILEHAADIELPGLKRAAVVELKLAGNKDEELYRLLLVAQCNALNKAMPFLFEKIGDETELLLPAGLLQTDSLISGLVGSIDESAWEQIEVIGWLYQFYISEKKEQVIGKVVKSEDIPAATQLFTPNWIVKYMVQNTLGAQWLATYPNSPLRAQMEYYIEPAEQTEDVKAQLAEITPSALNPEELTLLDPACGSGHILVEAYEIFKAIYLERGYRQRDVPRLILEKNLFGLDIDERAAQLAGFALMMKGRADDRALFERGVKQKVLALRSSALFEPSLISTAGNSSLTAHDLAPSDLANLRHLFEHAEILGSLLVVPESLVAKLAALDLLLNEHKEDLFSADALRRLAPLVEQSKVLAKRYDAVVANPPYMGGKYQTKILRQYLKSEHPGSKSDLFAASAERYFRFAKDTGLVGLMTPFTWMFLKSYQSLRQQVLNARTLHSLVQPEYHAFFDSAYVPVCAFVTHSARCPGYVADFIRLAQFYGSALQGPKTLEAVRDQDCSWRYRKSPDQFRKIPGRPIAYWASDTVLDMFETMPSISENCKPVVGLQTGDNPRFIRRWQEVSMSSVAVHCGNRAEAVASGTRWFPYTKGGEYRKWFGNNEHVVDWLDDGHTIRNCKSSVVRNPDYYLLPGIAFTNISSTRLGARATPAGFLFDQKGSMFFAVGNSDIRVALGFLLSNVAHVFLEFLCPTMDFNIGTLGILPLSTTKVPSDKISAWVQELIDQATLDWNTYERSWAFPTCPILSGRGGGETDRLAHSYYSWVDRNKAKTDSIRELENKLNRAFIDGYGLADEINQTVPDERLTVTINPAYRYGTKLTAQERETRFREDTMEELVSYAIGCMMGRYSLDEPGLIYANAGDEGFDASRYATFPADEDGILPLTDSEWFADDTCHRLVEFISVAWDKAHLEENLAFLASNLSPKKNESSRDTLRRYLCDKFFKDHVQTYKKRPIYWLFSSGKQKAFQCLVYLHRYNAGTLARMRSEYVIALQGKLAARVEKLEADVREASSTAEGKRLSTERAKLVRHQTELLAFDEKLRHFTDQRITLDLDDGVKVNYGKFGDLLADVKAITGGKEES